MISDISRKQGSIQSGGLALIGVSGVSTTAIRSSGVKQSLEEVLSDLTEADPNVEGFPKSLSSEK